jgi:4-hydroxybenzoate polyprenyltransferase
VSTRQALSQEREGQTFGGHSLLARYASFVKLPHTFFALPFAGVGAVLASYNYPERITVGRIGWVVLAFTAARFAAMGFNRIVDARLDALNPRTRMRELPTGRLSLPQALSSVIVAAAVFVLAAWMLNPLCGWLSLPALAWIFFYSFTKRFTAAAHHVLGFALGIAPGGAYLAISGEWSTPWYALWILAGAVTFWVAGFDIIYAVQDVDFDRAQGLHSVPAATGVPRALRLASAFHAVALLLFLLIGVLHAFPVGWLYLTGVAGAATMLLYEHRLVRGQDGGPLVTTRIDRAFFRVNIAVSATIFLFTLLDRLILA